MRSLAAEFPHLSSDHGAVQLTGALIIPQLKLQRSQSSCRGKKKMIKKTCFTAIAPVGKNYNKKSAFIFCQNKLKACKRTEEELRQTKHSQDGKSNLVQLHLSSESQHNTAHVNTGNPPKTRVDTFIWAAYTHADTQHSVKYLHTKTQTHTVNTKISCSDSDSLWMHNG